MITLFHKFAFKTQCSSDNIAVKWETSISVDLLYQSCDIILKVLFVSLCLSMISWELHSITANIMNIKCRLFLYTLYIHNFGTLVQYFGKQIVKLALPAPTQYSNFGNVISFEKWPEIDFNGLGRLFLYPIFKAIASGLRYVISLNWSNMTKTTITKLQLPVTASYFT